VSAMTRAGALAVLAFVLGAGPAVADPPAGNAGEGKRVYLAVGCFECHGRVGQGGAYYGLTPPLAKTELPYEAFLQQLRDPSNNMPAYAESVLPEKQVADIYAYLQSLPPRPVPEALPAILTH
jgi:mono/diheme cytochrome c family protein